MADTSEKEIQAKIKVEEKKTEKPVEETPKIPTSVEEKKEEIKKLEGVEPKKDIVNDSKDKKTESKVEDSKDKKPEKKKEEPKVHKNHAEVHSKSLPISLKHSVAIGRFIKNKKINDAINDLEDVIKKKRAVPMRGELPHRKGRMSSGRYPKKASENFIKLLKAVSANSAVNGLDLDKTRIKGIMANKAPDQMHRHGRTKFKRTHVKILVKEGKK